MSYYKILNVDPLASMENIKEAYLKYINIKEEDDKRDIEKAYQTLSNYNSRRMYDNQSENINLIKDVTPSNGMDGNEYFLNEEHENFSQIDSQDKFSNNNLYSSRSFSENFDNQMINLNRRLEQIEKKIEICNKTNFYREKKVITEVVNEGKKKVTIEYNTNDNGKKTKSTKVIEYDETGKKKKMYYAK
jgi:DnaJ-class molecular chaperone